MRDHQISPPVEPDGEMDKKPPQAETEMPIPLTDTGNESAEPVAKLTKREQRLAESLKYYQEKHEAQRPYRGWFQPKADEDEKDANS